MAESPAWKSICFTRDSGDTPPGEDPGSADLVTQAIQENPRNASLTPPNRLVFPNEGPAVDGTKALAMYTTQFWAAGKELLVGFMGGSEWQQLQVKNYAPQWSQHANLKFKFGTSGPYDIYVDFTPGIGSWSKLGKNSQNFAKDKKRSMNLSWINPDEGDDEIRGTILHEFGHAIGAIHEHESPFASIPWNKERVYEDLGGPPNRWNRSQVDDQMFSTYSLSEVQGTSFDNASVMLYNYPKQWTTDGSSSPRKYDLTEFDKKYARFCYPPAEYDAQQYSIVETRPLNREQQLNQKMKWYYQRYQAPPQLALALTSIDVSRDQNLRIQTTATDMDNDKFIAHIDSWNNSSIWSASMSFLEKVPGRFDYLQIGTYNTAPDNQSGQQQNAKRINFEAPFDQPPKVVAFLNKIALTKGKNWRIRAYVSDIDTHGFTMHVDAWADTLFNSASVTWLAHPSNQPGVTSGRFGTDDIREWSAPRHENVGTAAFAPAFDRVPKVFMGLDTLDFDSRANLRLRLSTSGVSPTGITWHLQSYSDSVMYRSGASYFAWAE